MIQELVVRILVVLAAIHLVRVLTPLAWKAALGRWVRAAAADPRWPGMVRRGLREAGRRLPSMPAMGGCGGCGGCGPQETTSHCS